ncbi:hypothetical protein ACQEVM_17500 [Streptomyces sp. CA-243310]|uniref:hypothetical protein n=1 Tax=Streptomyces sp. CA-243310 TaxID=3240056 RepID=UPI003D8CD50C
MDPVRTCVSTWYALLGEMRMAAQALDAAAVALDHAQDCLERYGQSSSEALVILLRAQLARAAGDDRLAVRRAETARAVALGQEAHLFVRRADRLLAELGR